MDYLIWSFSHKAWWGKDYLGYVTDIDLAGRYTSKQAGAIAVDNQDRVVVHEHLAELYGPPLVSSLWGARVKHGIVDEVILSDDT